MAVPNIVGTTTMPEVSTTTYRPDKSRLAIEPPVLHTYANWGVISLS